MTVGASVHSGAYSWIYINFETGHDGYVVQSYLLPSTGTTVTSDDSKQSVLKGLLIQLAMLQKLLAQLKAGN